MSNEMCLTFIDVIYRCCKKQRQEKFAGCKLLKLKNVHKHVIIYQSMWLFICQIIIFKDLEAEFSNVPTSFGISNFGAVKNADYKLFENKQTRFGHVLGNIIKQLQQLNCVLRFMFIVLVEKLIKFNTKVNVKILISTLQNDMLKTINKRTMQPLKPTKPCVESLFFDGFILFIYKPE